MSGRERERQAARRRAGLALAASLAAHALLVLVAVRLSEHRPPAASTVRITLDLQEIVSPAPRPTARPPAVALPERPRSPERRPQPAPRPEPAPVEPAPPPETHAEARPDPDEARQSGRGGASGPGDGTAEGTPGGGALAGDGASAGGGLAVPPDLFSDRNLIGSLERRRAARSRGTGDGDVDGSFDDLEGEPEGNDPEAERRRVTRRIGHDAARAQAESRVQSGLVDPYFARLQKEMRKAFEPAPGMFDAPGEGGTGPLASAKRALRDYLSAGKQFASTGTPYETTPPRELHLVKPLERPAGGESSGFDAGDFAAKWNNGDFAFLSGLVLVQLTQDEQGRPLEARVVASSGRPGLDRSAREAVMAAAAGRPAPQSGLGLGGTRIKSLWQLKAKLVRCSPNPAGTFDENALLGLDGADDQKPVDLCEPFQQRVKTTVELVAVFGGATRPVETPDGSTSGP